MKLTFLGTGTSTGVPTLGCDCEVCKSNDPRDKRLRCSALLEIDKKKIMFDCGPDFRQQALSVGLTWIDAILLTHAHSDHVAGIDELRTIPFARYNWKLPDEMASEKQPLPRVQLYGLAETTESVKKLFFYCFPKVEPGKPQYKGMLPLLELHNIEEPLKAFKVADEVEVIPIKAMHAYLPVLGYRIGKFAYLTDLKTIEESELEKLKQLDVLVLGMLRHNKDHISHLSLSEAMAIVERVKPQRVYFIHMSHDIGFHVDFHNLTYSDLLTGEKRNVPEFCNLAYDGLEVEF